MHVTHDEVDLQLEVVRRHDAAEGVVVLELRAPSGDNLPEWSPGAHIDLEPAPGMVRQYSLCGDPAERDVWRIGVLREPAGRGGSAFVHDRLHLGTLVPVRGPRNNFPFEPAGNYVFVAGGIGITPLLPMLSAADGAGAQWRLHYGGRTRGSMAFVDNLQNAHPDRVAVHPQDEVGLLDLPTILGDPQPDTLVYACGPEPLLQAIEQRCAAWPEGSLHVERFSPKAVGEPVRTTSFEVELTTSGMTLTVPPDKSILQVAAEAGVSVLYSCEEGTCGTCETNVLAGEVDHRDSLLSPTEQAAHDTMFICVSRAAGPRLVLEL
ncbi:PDR/VanB family oxidoreductase [Pseudonocardia sp. WMMC193]|uniref:PDR/VanB family oxidoreductase n=1 Tax=Pseudonocardia sp. WMMC193 TaxID=2911965 RepID=UPI001F439975|nr:PDR/VanB family oxidoreductase [Pseudonocardia sp. WMMC193]MCF7547465.1 PDR/VanB family oxidoreductase [Pseudonocardia sp. WMMC193]